MATFSKFNSFVEALAEKRHNLGSDTLMVALTNTAPTNANSVLTDIAQYNAGSYPFLSTRVLTTVSSLQTGGVYALVLSDLVLTSSGGSTGPFRYVVVYNDTATNDELIAYYDYGTAITLADNETLTLDFTGNMLTIT